MVEGKGLVMVLDQEGQSVDIKTLKDGDIVIRRGERGLCQWEVLQKTSIPREPIIDIKVIATFQKKEDAIEWAN